ncbi:TrmH family RNA methyltransferase [Litorimonas sp. WD9-15]|uniref:TrmH family RNA methyltransferase n=1 Tax=Litorimonas sp. WD9-15 TaxID=3418716 RepID=UPI003D00D37D
MSLRSRGMKGPSADAPKRAYGAKSHGATTAPRPPKKSGGRKKRAQSRHEGGSGWIWGTHACLAVLANPRRTIHEVLITEAAQNRLDLPSGGAVPQVVDPQALDRLLPKSTVHQGIAVKAAPLEWQPLEVIADNAGEDGLILVLDQITDPHNVGAMLRLCSAFGVSALVMQTRKAPPLSGALAKVAVGCLETIPVCLETNIANTLQNLQRIGWQVTGLAGETDIELSDAFIPGVKQVIVMGAEGPGLRERVRKTCDRLARIPMRSGAVVGEAESLNVATAAGIALYEARRG